MRKNPTKICRGCISLAVWLCCVAMQAQTTTTPLSFESASVKPAQEDAATSGTGFMIGLSKHVPPRGLLTMTSPLAPLIMFAYDVQDEVEARAMRARLPEWAQRKKYTIVARPPLDTPTQEQIRQMIRTLLEDRFALKAHRASHDGPVKVLSVAKAGVTGPDLKPHDATKACVQRGAAGGATNAEPAGPAPVYCGLDLYQIKGGMFHVSMIDVTLPEACTLLGGLGGVLGGRGMDTIVDGTGLQGKWDITLDFLPERDGPAADASSGEDIGGPTFTAALEKWLGLRLKKGTGQVEDLIIDHIAEPTPD